ncbi:hypothetical protein [Thiocapsa rosea]|nr:hypothetical protein [Thiocapsa rosea]
MVAVIVFQSASAESNDWPCQQILVPQVSAAVVWDGPPVGTETSDWHDDPRVATLVAAITTPLSNEETAASAIAAFAAGLSAEEKDRVLTLAFAGVLETLNRDRAKLVEGIKRYSRDQSRRAEAIGAELDAMVRLEKDPSDAAAARLAELTERMEIEQRVFDERERSIEYLCMRPVAVEQRLGFLARRIAEHLD